MLAKPGLPTAQVSTGDRACGCWLGHHSVCWVEGDRRSDGGGNPRRREVFVRTGSELAPKEICRPLPPASQISRSRFIPSYFSRCSAAPPPARFRSRLGNAIAFGPESRKRHLAVARGHIYTRIP